MIFVVFIEDAVDAEDFLVNIAKGLKFLRMSGTILGMTVNTFIWVDMTLAAGLFLHFRCPHFLFGGPLSSEFDAFPAGLPALHSG
jgi:hypothetical protein